MDNHKENDGCAPMRRRNFLFFFVVAIATIYKEFSIQAFQCLLLKAIALFNYLNYPGSSENVPSYSLPDNQPLPDIPVIANPPAKPMTFQQVSPTNQPVTVTYKTLAGVSFYQTTIDLTEPKNLITIGLANNAQQANSSRLTNGEELFENMVARYRAVVVANGTFFSTDRQKRVMGNMVAGGKFLKYRPWENYGTTLGLKAGNQPEMITARTEGKPQWQEHWFSLTCGPRLLKQGKIWLAPRSEGFRDPAVLDIAYRTAVGFTADKTQLFLVAFMAPLSLEEEAKLMKSLGCFEAMNLDGGSSEALAYQGNVLISPQRKLTNTIVVYDRFKPAPKSLKTSWQQFQMGDRPAIPQ